MDKKISAQQRQDLINTINLDKASASRTGRGSNRQKNIKVDEGLCDFKQLPAYKELTLHHTIARQAGIIEPFFKASDGIPRDTTLMNDEEHLNFSTYDYLGLNGTERLNNAATKALQHHGTSASASRIVSGERPSHREFEKALATFYGMEDCLTFVSGHATNVWAISQLLNTQDLIVYDSLSHNSIVYGAKSSGAKRLSFKHNDYHDLEKILRENRSKHKRTLIVTEGLFSMDGDIPNLPKLIILKKKYSCFLMIDEAHSLGVLGKTGRGIAEHFGIDSQDIDIIMGTLSKTLCGCGGYIASKKEFIELLKYTAPGFVYSVGMSPPLVAASHEALNILIEQPQRVQKIRELSLHFVQEAEKHGFDIGKAKGYVVIPLMVGNSLVAGLLAEILYNRHINVSPIIYPAVEDSEARLRFFITHWHNKEQITEALNIVAQELPHAQQRVYELAAK